MNQDVIKIRQAQVSDAAALLAIYAPYVTQTAISFEYEVPSLADFQARIESTRLSYPYLVAEDQGTILGYAYLGRFQSRPAYDWASEISVYVNQTARGKGIGRILYEAIELIARQQGIRNLYACIAYPSQPDNHLTMDSVYFHQHLGYQEVGHFHACGYKFDTWYDMVWMEKQLTGPATTVRPFVPFKELVVKGLTI